MANYVWLAFGFVLWSKDAFTEGVAVREASRREGIT
jgi:hypothetical protein